MQTYCVSCRKDNENKKPKVFKTKNGRLILKSVCSVYGHKETRSISKNKGSGLLSSVGIRAPLSRIPGLNILF